MAARLGRFSYLKASRSHGILNDELIGAAELLYDPFMRLTVAKFTPADYVGQVLALEDLVWSLG